MKGTMATEQESYIETAIKMGKDKHTTHRELVSEGIATTDFEDNYRAVLTRLGVSEPKPPAPVMIPSGEVKAHIRKPKNRFGLMRAFFILILCCVLAGVLWFLSPKMPQVLDILLPTIDSISTGSTPSSASFGEGIIKTKVDATFASARIYKGKLLDYQGACTGVSVVPPVACKENTVSLVIYAPLEGKGYYCVDSSGATGSQVDLSGEIYRCK
jgi:hypothetical protein